MSRSRAWVFTVNNPETIQLMVDIMLVPLQPWSWPGCVFCVYQAELGERGTLHYQGYVEFQNPRLMAGVKLLPGLTGAHLEVRRGSAQQAADYASKDDTRYSGPWTWGVMSEPQGKRNDLLSIKTDVDEGALEAALWESHFPTMVRYGKAIMKYAQFKRAPRTWATKLITLVGPTGCGKTRWCHENFPGLYKQPPGKWWDGYDGHEVVLFDEMNGGRFKFTELLQLLDRYPTKVEVKGGMVEFVPKLILMTSNHVPSSWYNNTVDEWNASPLRRRLYEDGNHVYFAGEPHRMVGEIRLEMNAGGWLPQAFVAPVLNNPGLYGDHLKHVREEMGPIE